MKLHEKFVHLGISFLLTYNIIQHHKELLFGKIRSQEAFNNNPIDKTIPLCIQTFTCAQ